MTNRIHVTTALLAALFPAFAAAGAMDECAQASDRDATAKCLATLDGETTAELKKAETAAGKAARDVEVASKRPGAYTAFASASRTFPLYQQAQCDYVRALQADATARPTDVPSAADVARVACRIDLARERIEALK